MPFRNREKISKILIIGLDGATFDLIDPLVMDGKLPNIEKIIKEGAKSPLRSTIHPNTPMAWTSLLTGKNPGKHGLFDFRMRREGSYELEFASSMSVKEDTVWKILNKSGRKVGIINVPLSYPPSKVDGFIISGMHTPSLNKGVFPPELYIDLKRRFPDYRIDCLSQEYDSTDLFIQDLHEMIESRAEVAKYLHQKYHPEFFMVVFVATDRIQHLLWKEMTSGKGKYKDEISKVYQRCDKKIGEILDLVDKDTTAILVSDHGFGSLEKDVYLNNFLAELDLLNYFDNKAAALDKKKRGFHNIDWSRTKAYSYGFFGNIFMNLKGREPKGTVEPGREYEELKGQLIKNLYQLKDPEDGGKIVDKVYKREELFSGPYLERVPDLLLIMRDYSLMSRDGSEFERNSLVSEPLVNHTGNHRMNGILCVMGDGIKKNLKGKNAQIIDVAPTLLYMMGLPVPEDMDGRILIELFEEEYLLKNPTKFAHTRKMGDREIVPEVYLKEEIQMIKKRLKGLGYFG